MRIAVINWSNRMAGGAETYLRQIIPALRRQGHQVAFGHEGEEPEAREPIGGTEPQLTWSGIPAVLEQLTAWRPDLLFVHGLTRYDWLFDIVKSVPTAFFCQDYAGICISGTKTFRMLSARSCDRAFGWQCLAHYYPCHCGGWSPVSMWREYGRQSERLRLMRLGRAIVTASTAMRQEFLRNGFAPERVHLVPLMPHCEIAPSQLEAPSGDAPWQLLFAGRMEWLKGGDILLDSLPQDGRLHLTRLHLTMCGDGTCRADWERKAALLQSDTLRIEFIGWQNAGAMQAILDRTHLLVLPSVWPEPFGLIGVEAGCHGVPVAAFRKGGIPDWLKDGVNGFMAPGDPPRERELTEAIVKCLADYKRLRSGAVQMAREFTLARHLESLNGIFERIVERKAA